jgi:putative transposase
LLEDKCAEQQWEIVALAMQPDHVHLFVRVSPSESAAGVVKECKGITSFHLRREFAHLRRLPSMWTRSSFASTAGTVSQQTLQRSSDAQMGR